MRSEVAGLSLEWSRLSTGEGLQKVRENLEIFLLCLVVLTLLGGDGSSPIPSITSLEYVFEAVILNGYKLPEDITRFIELARSSASY